MRSSLNSRLAIVQLPYNGCISTKKIELQSILQPMAMRRFSKNLVFAFNLGCMSPYGMENRQISDSQIKSSTQLDENHSAKHSRLHSKANRENGGSWSALKNDVNQWLQVDLGTYVRVTGIATQGRNGRDEWVTKFSLQYGEDGDTFHFFENPGDFVAKVCILKWFSQ